MWSDVIMSLLRKNWAFLQSLLREANAKRREVMLDRANKSQINAISEMVLNVLKRNVPIKPRTLNLLKRYKTVLREIGSRRNSLKRRRAQLKSQKGGAFWNGLRQCYLVCSH